MCDICYDIKSLFVLCVMHLAIVTHISAVSSSTCNIYIYIYNIYSFLPTNINLILFISLSILSLRAMF